ncbi:type III-B CRISPR module-associated protein Cmr5 [Caldanaerobacter subterraneus]|uniref:CRISPR type III-B/RAMP module-associated protein Cmr5 n=1 Tax=Caldanaerobacter subterraneus TaxID=911092 RepID=A0A7Y2PL44_9THEO|nr:type III-B CRISPR module-associated protein Cmr5 [Caldanaerobacter subterraneus]
MVEGLKVKTLEQERASFCLKEIEELPKGKDKRDKYKTNVRRLPAFIVSNGLIPTLAFYKSKEETKPVYDTLNKWLQKRGYISENKDALDELVDKDFQILRLATTEILALANWLKRTVEIEIKEEKDDLSGEREEQ